MIKIEGIKPGSTYARSILDKIEVKCTFCKLANKEIEGDDYNVEQQDMEN